MLEIRQLSAGYGKVQVLHGVSIDVVPGEVVAIIGSNGAGKTTLFKSLFGFVDVYDGTRWLDGRDLSSLHPYELAGLGIAHVPEGRGLFPGLSVLENLLVPTNTQRAASLRDDNLALVFELFPRLKDRLDQQAGTMSGGEQQMLAIARGLMAAPRLLMLDEPSIGLAPKLVDDMFDKIRSIREVNRDLAILIVEQRVTETLALADRGYVMELGSIVLEGTSHELEGNPMVERAFLGMSGVG